jgi:RsiW-degrading membrane proteinase PrsW (M82 family)
MIILMIMAGCYGVIQLALLASPARTLRISSLLLAVAAGAYGCAVVALALEFGYTRMVHAVSGDSLSVVVERAGYTVDPVIEELVKLLPLVVLLMACRRLRRQWSLVDYLLFGAATGAGFALTEALLRFG